MNDRRKELSVHMVKDLVGNVIENQDHALTVEKLDIELRIIHLSKKRITRIMGEFKL